MPRRSRQADSEAVQEALDRGVAIGIYERLEGGNYRLVPRERLTREQLLQEQRLYYEEALANDDQEGMAKALVAALPFLTEEQLQQVYTLACTTGGLS